MSPRAFPPFPNYSKSFLYRKCSTSYLHTKPKEQAILSIMPPMSPRAFPPFPNYSYELPIQEMLYELPAHEAKRAGYLINNAAHVSESYLPVSELL